MTRKGAHFPLIPLALSSFLVLAAIAAPSLLGFQAAEPQQLPSHAGDADRRAVQKVFQRYCLDCHGESAQEAGIRLDTLDLSLVTPKDNEILERVLEVVVSGRMPPDDVDGPSTEERKHLGVWLRRGLARAALERRREGRGRVRRLTVEEYNRTMQDLFGVEAEFAANLPPDPVSREGYQNDRTLLGLSPLQMECYLENARQAVRRYVQFGPPAEQALYYHVEFEELYYSTDDRYGTRKRAPRPVSFEAFQARVAEHAGSAPQYVGPLSPIPPGDFPTKEELRLALPKLHQQFLAIPERISSGELIVRIRAAATPDRSGRFPRMRLEAGITLGDSDAMDTRVIGEVDVTAPLDEPATYEFRARVEDIPTKGRLKDEDAYDRLSLFDMDQFFISNVSRDDRTIYALGPGSYRDPDSPPDAVEKLRAKMRAAGVNFLYVDSIQIEMLPDRNETARWSVEWADAQTEEEQTAVDREFLQRFMRRACRRPVSPAEVATKVALLDGLRQQGYSFEESLQETLTAVLVAPQFLFREYVPPDVADSPRLGPTAHQLASRLSYLLWLAPPDERLIRLADDGSLLRDDVWAGEAERMLDDPRSRRFLDSFCRQWLRLDKFPLVAISPEAYPDYDDDLAEATIQETLAFFSDVFTSGSSALDLINSDYAFLNDRLADHYGVENVVHGDLKKVRLPEGSVRGGLLAHASLLTMNSDGVDSHPIRRGVWLLDRLLNAPPPPPPDNVPDLNEDDSDFGGLSLKQRIAVHREPGACQSCHRKIDPWGLAFEHFDATGRWREQIQGRQSGAEQSIPVDAAVELPGGERVHGVRGLKRYIHKEHSEQFARALVHHMLTYALGRPLDFADRPTIDAVYERFAASDYRLGELVLAIVEDEAFRR